MNQRVAHPVGEVEPQLRVALGKRDIRRLNFTCGLTDDLEIADDRILNERTLT